MDGYIVALLVIVLCFAIYLDFYGNIMPVRVGTN